MNKMWYKHTMECTSAIKRNEVLTHAITSMHLKTTQSERSQTHLCEVLRVSPPTGTGSILAVAAG